MHTSEVAHLRERIEQEYQAGRLALEGLSCGGSKHAFISRKIEQIGRLQAELSRLVGEEKAMNMVLEVFDAG